MPAGAALSLGQITFGIGPDTTNLRSSISDITNFGSAVESAAASTAAGAARATAALIRQENAAIAALQRVQKFQDQLSKSNVSAPVFQGLNNLSTTALQRMSNEMTSGRLNALEYSRAMTQFGQTMTNAQRILNQYNAAQKVASEGAMVEALRKLNSAAVLVAGPLSGIATRISVITGLTEHFSISTAALVAGIAAGAYSFTKMSTAIIDVERELNKLNQTLTAVEGNQTIAATTMNYLVQFSNRAGVGIQELAKQYSQLEAASKGTILEGQRTRDIFEAVTLAGAKLGLSTTEVTGTLLALQQMISKGKISSEELRQQLGDRLPGAVQIMAQALGVTTQKLDQMMKKGELGISTLVKFGVALKARYNIDNNTTIDSITASENRLANARIIALDQLDKIVGISSAYKNVLDSLSGALKFTDNQMRQVVTTVVSIGVALTAAFAATRIVPMVLSIAGAVNTLAASVWALNTASLAGGITSLGKIFLTLGIAAAAYYGSQKLLSDQMDKFGKSTLSSLPAVDAYIQANSDAKNTITGTTKAYIAQAEALEKTQEQLKIDKVNAYLKAWDMVQLAASKGVKGDALQSIADSLNTKGLAADADKATAAFNKTKQQVTDLYAILDAQTKKENTGREDPAKALTDRQTLALKNASDTVKELQQQYDNMFKAPAAKDYLDTQNAINKSVENFRDQLTRTGLSTEVVNQKTAEYAAALRKVKEGNLALKNTTSWFQALEGVFSRGLDTAMNNFVDGIFQGKSALETLRDTGKQVAADLLKTWLQLAALNPLKNMLFGTDYKTMGGSAGIGGVLGNLLSGGTTSSGTAGFSNVVGAAGGIAVPTLFAGGGIMTSEGPLPLRKYAGGGIADSPQLAMFGEGSKSEAYVPLPDGRSIPVSMRGGAGAGGGNNVQVNIINQSGAQVSHKSKQSGGLDVHDIVISSVQKGFANDEFKALGTRRKKRR